MKKSDHLPVYGVGPICIYLMVGLTIAGIVMFCNGLLDTGNVGFLKWPCRIVGAVLIVCGIVMWCRAVIVQKIGDSIKDNHLVVTGIYSYVRNPIYSAIAIALTGVILTFANLWLLILPFLFWLDITLMMRFTEEKWLLELYGDEYSEYCRKVNRCIPWFPKH